MAEPGQVAVVDEASGQVGYIPAEQAERAAGQGFRAASPEEVAQAEKEAKYGGIGGTVAAAGAGLLRGGTAGISDAIGAELGLREDLEGLQSVHGGASLAGEVAGGLLGAGKLRGASMVARGARAISAPARLITRAGSAAGRMAGGGVRGAIATGLVEGAAFGAGSAISEAALQNKELTAELLASHALQGAAFGGGVAGGVGLIGRAASKGYQSLAKAAHGYAPKGIGAAAADVLDTVAAGVGSAERGAVKGMLSKGRGGKYGFEIATSADDILAKSADDITDAYRGVLKAEQAVERNFSGALKHKNIAKLVRQGDEELVRAQAMGMAQDVRAFGDDLMTGELKAITKGSELGKNFRHQLEVVEDMVSREAKGGFNAQAFMELDELKRQVGKVREHLQGKLNRGGSARIRKAAAAAEDTYEKLRGHLQDASIWGDAATVQSSLNAPWSQLIPTKAELRKRLTNPGKAGKWGATTHDVSRDKVGAWVRDLRNPDKSDTAQAVKAHLDGLRDFADEAKRSLDLSPSDRRAVEELAGNVDAMRTKLDDATDAIAKSNQLKDMAEAGHEGSATIGALLGGAPGAMAGKALEVALNPAKGIRQLAHIHSMMQKTEQRVGKSLARIMDNAGPSKALRGVTRAAVRVDSATRDPIQEAKDARDAPGVARERISKRLGAAAMGAPTTATAAVDKALLIQQLLGKALPELPDQPMMGGASEVPPWAQKKFQRLQGVLQDPPAAIEGMRKGDVTAAQMSLLKQAYPEWFSTMQQQMADHLVGGAANGKLLPYRERVMVGVLWDLPSDPMLELVPLMQGNHSAPLPEEPPVGPPPKKNPGPAPDIADDMRMGVEARLDEA